MSLRPFEAPVGQGSSWLLRRLRSELQPFPELTVFYGEDDGQGTRERSERKDDRTDRTTHSGP